VRTVRRVLTAIVLLALAIAVALFAFVWWGQERITYQPPRVAEPTPAGAERVEYLASDGQPLYALVVGTPSRPARVLLAFHGNADIAPWLVPWAAEIAQRTGYVVVLAEYRGYNGLTGAPQADGIRLDARAALAFVRTRFGADARIAYYGHSLGTAVAAELASESPPSVLILESPFTAAADMAALFGTPLARIAWRLFGRIPYDTHTRVQTIDAPVWVAHGDRDRVIPVRMGRAVFAAARRPGELLIVPGGGHNGLAESGGAAYWEWIARALR
jgi:hypothetical protein